MPIMTGGDAVCMYGAAGNTVGSCGDGVAVGYIPSTGGGTSGDGSPPFVHCPGPAGLVGEAGGA